MIYARKAVPVTKPPQAMLIAGINNLSQIKTCLETAHHFFLSEQDALAIFEKQKQVIETHWNSICDEAQLIKWICKIIE